MKKIEPIPPSLPLLTKGEFYLEDEEIFSGLLINGGNQSYLDAKNMVLRESHIQKLTMQKTGLRHFECSNVILNAVMSFLKNVIFPIWSGLVAVSTKSCFINVN